MNVRKVIVLSIILFINYIYSPNLFRFVSHLDSKKMTGTDQKYLVDKDDRLILPENIVPKVYDLHLTPDLVKFTFEGLVDIHLDVVKASKVLVIHSIELKLHSATIQGQQATIEYYEPEEVAILTFDKEVTVGKDQVLSIKYTGTLNDKLKGFYRSKYTFNGEERYIATTQCEATDFRRIAPSMDEPALKAVFNIKLTIKSNLEALSNMEDISSVDNKDGTKTVTFDKTPVMSTYLVAFVVGEFTYVESKTKEGIRVRVYQVIGKEEKGDFALDVATRALSFFIDYFEIPFPLKKCDHIAIPDFAFGAMENWGLITYREVILLTSDKTTTRTKQRIANVIGHELAHQYFGNLVSPTWWSQLWLNEGFATFMGYLVTDKLFPEWNVWMDFLDAYGNGALNLDSLDNTHPVEVPVRSSSQINEIFDAISYNKGSCIIRMLESRFGDKFRQGLSHYLNKHSYGNTKTEDLWESISLKTGVNVNEFIDNFTKKPGYPVIKIQSTQKPGVFELTQRQFRLSGVENPTDPIWSCFIKVQTDQGPIDYVLDKKQGTLEIPNFTEQSWIKPNYGQAGYYRIEYDGSIISRLVPKIKSLELPATDRLGLLSDTFQLCKAGVVKIGVYMDLVSAYVNENESAIWDQIVSQLGLLSSLIYDQEYASKLDELQIKLYKPVYQKIGFVPVQGESSTNTLLRERIIVKLGQLGEPEVLAECRKRFEQFKSDPNSLPSDMRSYVFASVIRHGGEAEQAVIIEQYLKTNIAAERNTYLGVLAGSQHAILVEKALSFSLSKDVRMQDTYIVWTGIPIKAQPSAWTYLETNFKSINETFSQTLLFARMIAYALPYKASPEQYQHIEQFFVKNPVAVCERAIKQDLEKITVNTKWFNTFNNDLKQWLSK
ncbi:puromycin-sensitive aminopeptidase-like protein [Tieghemostelium lacteum]|uniref:Aminopeptidase n=1 Tax=Tieghemostelium lacteum TaxID=361077 RepID=A0A151Z7Q0_TIELA|nr:puromycin-sensitive aminopeptidase-like protein [Tieghemostelium lacteum]|eukprot:KYQ89958.1 puromycin-sensitive aminopeptidase-like protein [Tieghemostelium lacteum]